MPIALDISTRKREDWTRDERRVIDRAAKLLHGHGVAMKLACGSPVCPDPTLHVEPGAFDSVLRCGCTDRHFQRPLPTRTH